MTRSHSLVGALAITAALATPVAIAGQKAIPRGSGGDSAPAPAPPPSSSGGSGNSDGSSGGSQPSGSQTPPPSSPRAVPAGPRTPAAARRPPATAQPASDGRSGTTAATANGQARAIPRPPGRSPHFAGARFISVPVYGGWGDWYPWYGSTYGWNASFADYGPWGYGGRNWGWSRYGFGYDPFIYSSYDAWQPAYSGYVGRDDRARAENIGMGSLRLKISPRNARVYVDGALAGIADDFDGLSRRLDIEAGPHQLEFRAEGYVSMAKTVTVKAGRTSTLRESLKQGHFPAH